MDAEGQQTFFIMGPMGMCLALQALLSLVTTQPCCCSVNECAIQLVIYCYITNYPRFSDGSNPYLKAHSLARLSASDTGPRSSSSSHMRVKVASSIRATDKRPQTSGGRRQACRIVQNLWVNWPEHLELWLTGPLGRGGWESSCQGGSFTVRPGVANI